MKKCNSCGEQIQNDAKKCKHCGTDQRNWFRRHWIISTLFVLFIMGTILEKFEEKPSSNTNFKLVEQPKEYIDITCKEFSQQFGVSSKLSDLQKDELFKNYKNKWVRWNDTVAEISNSFGSLSMQVKCLPQTFISDVMETFDDSEKNFLLNYKQDDEVKFEGQLRDWGAILLTNVENGKIINE